jgi:hypothetical protein
MDNRGRPKPRCVNGLFEIVVQNEETSWAAGCCEYNGDEITRKTAPDRGDDLYSKPMNFTRTFLQARDGELRPRQAEGGHLGLECIKLVSSWTKLKVTLNLHCQLKF